MSKELVELCKNTMDLMEKGSTDPVILSRYLVTNLCEIAKVTIAINPTFEDFEFQSPTAKTGDVKQRLFKIFQGDLLYKQVYDPFEDEEAVTFSLVNDLSEIYEALQVYLFEVNQHQDAANLNFKEAFRNHLYQHIFNATKVIYIKYLKDE